MDAAVGCRAARIVGLMALPPAPDDPEDSRPWFRRLRDLRDGWLAAGVPAAMLRELSMGMSGISTWPSRKGHDRARGYSNFWEPRCSSLEDILSTDARRSTGTEPHERDPIDVRQARFGTALRGFNRTEVTAFLDAAAEGYEPCRCARMIGCARRSWRLEASLNQYRDVEGSLKNTADDRAEGR
jgi:DivIVA domain-containing protein